MKKILFLTTVSLLFFSAAFAKSSLRDSSKRHDTIVIRDGSSFEKAIVIMETNEGSGGRAEYKWLADHYPGYRMGSQALVFHEKKPYDILKIETAEGVPKEVYFDISNYFGKW